MRAVAQEAQRGAAVGNSTYLIYLSRAARSSTALQPRASSHGTEGESRITLL